MSVNKLETEFNVNIYKHIANTSNSIIKSDSIYDTGPLPIWINTDTILEQRIEDIRENDTAFAMFINQIREREGLYQKAMNTVDKANKKLIEMENKAKDRKLAVIIMTIAEIMLSISIGGMFTKYAIGFVFVVIMGLIMTILSLYLNFKK